MKHRPILNMDRIDEVMEYQVICREEGGTVIVQRSEGSEPGGLERWTLEQIINFGIDVREIPFSDLYKQVVPSSDLSGSQETMEESTNEKPKKFAKKSCAGVDNGSEKFVQQQQQKWDSTSVTALLNVCQEHKKTEKFIGAKSWKGISENLAANGFQVTAVQCKFKFENLKKQFNFQRLKAERSGEDHVKWEYFDLMNNFMGSNPEIEPMATCSRSEFTTNSKKRLTFESERVDCQDHSQTGEKRQKNFKENEENPVASAILQLNEDANKRSEEMLKRMDKALELKNKALEMFQKMLDKL